MKLVYKYDYSQRLGDLLVRTGDFIAQRGDLLVRRGDLLLRLGDLFKCLGDLLTHLTVCFHFNLGLGLLPKNVLFEILEC